jgi:hypothetical protein
MKNVILLLSTVLFFACGSSNSSKQQSSESVPDHDHVAIYDFHTDHRCETCLAIEKATLATLDENFETELDDQFITFTLINADAEENAVIAEEYGAFGTTLAITIIKGDKKEIIDITNWAFDAIHGDNFESELTEKLNAALAKL